MKVFRLCSENEVISILQNRSFNGVGNYCSNTNNNNHTYQPNKKYLHFFKSKLSLLHLKTLQGRYICEYNIPQSVCDAFIGIGKYWDYVNFSELIEVKEFAIPTDCMQFNYLTSISKIINNITNIDFFFILKLYHFLL
jgi:hypothetical protein